MSMTSIGIGHYGSLCGKVFGTVQLAIERCCAVGALHVPGSGGNRVYRKPASGV